MDWALGLMTGTSRDGIDLALIRTDGETVAEHGPARTIPFAPGLRTRLGELVARPVPGPFAEAIERELTVAHVEAVREFLAHGGPVADAVTVIGFHGQTIVHAPHRRRTWQIGDGALLAREIGRPVVNDFRSADLAAGGQGAPLAPLYHAALAEGLERPLAVLNVGGVANVTWLDADGTVIAFDTGPGNAPIDDWISHRAGKEFDVGGAIARSGRIDRRILAGLLAHSYFDRPPAKSLDRNAFDFSPVAVLDAADGAATLTALVVRAVHKGLDHMPAAPRRWLVAGGGRHNHFLMECLGSRLPGPVAPVEAVGWRGDALEAEAFAFLAVRALRGLPLSLPSTTGVERPLTGGRLHLPEPVRRPGPSA